MQRVLVGTVTAVQHMSAQGLRWDDVQTAFFDSYLVTVASKETSTFPRNHTVRTLADLLVLLHLPMVLKHFGRLAVIQGTIGRAQYWMDGFRQPTLANLHFA